MEPITFQGGAFSEYYCTKLLWTDPQLAPDLNVAEVDGLYKRASSAVRHAQRQLDGKSLARSTYTQLLKPLAEILGWRLGEAGKIVTELEQEEEAGVPLLSDDGRKLARAVCISPGAHLDAAPAGYHRRFAPTLSLARVLSEENLDYGLLLNAYELRLVSNVGTLPSYIGFDLSAIAEGTAPGQEGWRLLYSLLRQPALASEPCLLDRVRKIGSEHQQSVSTSLGRQVQRAIVRFMQGILDHPENRDRLPHTITDSLLHDLYEQTLRLLYRLLFCLYAEDLNLLPMDMLTYREGYSLKRLVQMSKGHAADSLEVLDPNGSFFQESLQALFALLRAGCRLGPEGVIEPYGGGLFDSGATRLVDGLAWGNATVDNVLELLTRVPAPKGQTGYVQLSYRELNVEQLGSIYEGLLEQTPAYAVSRVWQAELDSRMIVIDDASREHIREVRGETAASEAFAMENDNEPDDEDGETVEDDGESEDDAADDADEEERPKKRSAKKPLKIMAEIPARTVYLKGGLGRKQSGSYYTNRAFVNFLVREALEPLAKDRSPMEILALKVVDPAMGSAHFLVGACRNLAEHLLAAYRREVARLQAEDKKGEFSEADLLELAEVPPELAQVWNSPDQERELAVCRLLVAGNCIYGVDKNPLAVDLAKVSLWLVTAASRMPLTFLDHRLRCGDSLLGIPAEEVVRPWVWETNGAVGMKAKTVSRKPSNPVELLISPKHGQETFDYLAPSGKALCQSFTRAFACLRQLLDAIERDPSNFVEHQTRHSVLRSTLEPWWQVHQLRVGMAFQPVAPDPDILNNWLEDLLNVGNVSEEHRHTGDRFRESGHEQGAFCWELAFPEVFYLPNGQRREDAGFSCVLGNPPWDKIKPERDGFYLAYDPLFRQLSGPEKAQRIAQLHGDYPDIATAWTLYEQTHQSLANLLLDGRIYFHQTAVIEEEVEADQRIIVKKKTTGGDPDCYKFFLERAWQLARQDGAVGMVMSSGLHQAQGCTGLRRLLFNHNRVRAIVKFDNEMRVFPGVHNQFKFDLLVFCKGSTTEEFEAAFFSRETQQALQSFREHRCRLLLRIEDVQRFAGQTLTLLELRGQRDVDVVQKAYRLHVPFGAGLYQDLCLEYGSEAHMTNDRWVFRTRKWLRDHGCQHERGEQWRAATQQWYETRDYCKRPIVQWYALFQNGKPKAWRVPWDVERRKSLSEADLTDFELRYDLRDGFRLYAKAEEANALAFVPNSEVTASDLPAHIYGVSKIGPFRCSRALRPRSGFVSLVEGKSLFQFSYRHYAYVSGGGSWVVTRPIAWEEDDIIPQFFTSVEDARAIRQHAGLQLAFRSISGNTDERTGAAAIVPPPLISGNSLGILSSGKGGELELRFIEAWMNSFTYDFLLRICSSSNVNLHLLKNIPCPSFVRSTAEQLISVIEQTILRPHTLSDRPNGRAFLDAIFAEVYELSPIEYAVQLSTFPLLDRDQPPLPHDYRIRPTKKRLERRPISFITRDLALLTYFDYLAGRLETKPDPDRVARICPDGVPEPPTDIVAFFAQAGVDIGGKTEYAVASTGPFRDLRERVAKARELGAVAYVPTIDRRRATFVERAAAAGGLSPEEGVLTPEMAQHVLRAKAERDAKWQRAMQLWETTPNPSETVSQTGKTQDRT